jgi:ADP-ribose pyrophosphatase
MSVADSTERVYPGDVNNKEIQIITAGEYRYRGPYISINEDAVQFPSGKKGHYLRVTYPSGMGDGVVVAPIYEDREGYKLILVRQFRHAPRMWMYEFPRGFGDYNKTKEFTMRRELLQESGYKLKISVCLGRIVPDSGKLQDIPYLFTAKATYLKESAPEPTEAIDGIVHLKFSDLLKLCWNGSINDAFTLVATLRLQPYFKNDEFVIPEHTYIHPDDNKFQLPEELQD